MIIKKYDTKEEWLAGRVSKITGTKLKDIIVKRGTGHKIGFYQLIADRIAKAPDGEDAMERGARLEKEAIERFEKETKKKVNTDLCIWMRDDNQSVACSPDGSIHKEHAVVEIKCLSSARHIEAYLTKQVPDEYEAQSIQPFIVNDKLKKLYFCFYDPRVSYIDFFYLEITREQVEEKVKEYYEYQIKELAEIEEVVARLSKF